MLQNRNKNFQLTIPPKEFGKEKDHQAEVLKNYTMQSIEIATDLFWRNKNI